MGLLIKQNYMTNNDCYRTGQKIKPIGVMVHSDGCKAGIKANGWYSRWNKPGIEACVHAFIDDKECIEYLPTEKNNCHRAWHGGGSSNNTHIGFEMCEPTDYTDSAYFNKVYKNAVEYTAYLLKKHGITTVNDNTVLCHCEGYKKGIATNHGDVMHWFKYHNKTMDDFRNDVRKVLKGSAVSTAPSNQVQNIKVGSKVRVVGFNYATGETIPSWVKSNTYTVQQVNGDKCLLSDIISWVYAKDLQIISGGNTAPSTPSKKYLNLKPHMQKWAIYNQGGPYTTAYKIGDLEPAMFGGISYEILGNPATDVYIIRTRDYGKVAIWAPRDNDSSITNKPIY